MCHPASNSESVSTARVGRQRAARESMSGFCGGGDDGIDSSGGSSTGLIWSVIRTFVEVGWDG